MCTIKEMRFKIRGRYLTDYLLMFRAKKGKFYYFEYLASVVGTSCASFSRSSFLSPLITFILHSNIIETRNLYSSIAFFLHPHTVRRAPALTGPNYRMREFSFVLFEAETFPLLPPLLLKRTRRVLNLNVKKSSFSCSLD